MLSILFMVLKGWFVDVNTTRSGEGWYASFMFANFAKKIPTHYNIKLNSIKFNISCMFPLIDYNFYWSGS